MIRPDRVIELDGFSEEYDAEDWGRLKDQGFMGCVVKVSQGTSWANENAGADLLEAHLQGVLCGALVYIEPHGPSVDDQRAYLQTALPPVPLALGVILEIDAPRMGDPYGFGSELEAQLAILRADGYGVGIRCSSDTLAAMMGAPWGARLWLAENNWGPGGRPFARAEVWELAPNAASRVNGYQLLNLRAINPSPPVDRTTRPDVHLIDVPLRFDDAEPDRPVGDSGQNDISPSVDDFSPVNGDEGGHGGEDDSPEGDQDESDDWASKARHALNR
jgi:hypothetical protein